ncbi:SpaA isopeptide-forming pilin-related protein [[Eubacterium] hominis]|uniref:SpaA isopeptide-forming pilin-related protein n=1 Tax=[Eubacterium] hominis TaxID=2764325 RepID=UPI003A4DF0D1
MKRNTILNKLMKSALAGFYTMFALISTTPIMAASKYTATWKDTGYSAYRNFNIQDKFSGTSMGPGDYEISDFYIDDQKAYCVEPDVQISNNINYAHEKIYGRSGFKQAGFTDSQIDRMGYISSLGYGFQGDKSTEMLAATQLMIWQVSKPNGFSQIPSAIQAKMNIINSRLNVIYSDVSFRNKTIELQGYGKEYAITLTDTSKTFSAYLTNAVPKGIQIERSGNQLTIWADKDASETGNIVFDAYYLKNDATNTEIAYYQPLNQTLAVFGLKDPKSMRVSYKVAVQPKTADVSARKSAIGKIDVELKLNKIDKDSKRGIKDIEFEFFRDETSLGKAKTDDKGKVSMPSHVEQEFSSSTYSETYVTNWNDLNSAMQQYSTSKGWYPSEKEAQAVADKKALQDLENQISAYQNTKHTYKAVEISSGKYYYLDPDTTVSKELIGSGTVELNKDNQRYTLSIQLDKYDEDIHQGMTGMTKEQFDEYLSKGGKLNVVSDTGSKKTQGDAVLSGATFGLYASADIYNPENHTEILYHKGDKVLEVTTNENGYADTNAFVDKTGNKGLYFGDADKDCWYYWKEIKSPAGYEKSDLYYPVTQDMMKQEGEPYHFAIKTQISDKVRIGQFELAKFITDGENSETVKPEINAEFKAVAKKYYDQANGNINKALELAKQNGTKKEYAVLKTDDTGTAFSPKLAYGAYVVQQTSKGTNGQETELLAEPFYFYVSETTDGQTYVYGEDEKGNHIGSSSDGNVHYYINNRPFNSYAQVVKKDADTGKNVSLNYATFKVQMLDNNEKPVKDYKKKTIRSDEDGYISMKVGSTWYSEFTTNADNRISVGSNFMNFFASDKNYEENKDYDKGKVKLPVPLPASKYKLTEITAPDYFVLAKESKIFEITSSNVSGSDEDGEPVVEIEMMNKEVKGQLSVKKEGEVLTSVSKDDDGNLVFAYANQGIVGAVYEVRAREDVIDPADGSVMYKAGTVLDIITTGKDGIAESKKLPLSKLEIEEIKAPDGFTISHEIQEAELEYEDQNTELVFDSVTYYNDRQKLDMSVVKKDAETHFPLAGSTFGVYATEDIKSVNGNILVEKGTLIETAVSDTDGHVQFEADYPLSHYEIKEIKPSIGYATNKAVLKVDGTYQGQDIPVIEYHQEVFNEMTKFEVSKQDTTDSSEIEGAILSVYPKGQQGEIFDTWISGQDGKNDDGTIKPHLIKGLEINKTYILHEESSPYGFALANDIEFKVSDTGEVQKVIMKDELVMGTLKWNKTGQIFDQVITGQNEFGTTYSPVWNKSNLLNTEISIYAAEDIKIGNNVYYKADEKIEVLESDWDAVTSKKLPVGRYYYSESTTPHGYVTDTNKHYFSIEDSQSTELQIVTSTLENKRPTFDIDMTKLLEKQEIFKNEDAYKDVVFGIYAREDVYDYMGHVAIENGSMISTTGIDSDGHLVDVPDLPNGSYFIKELATNKQFVLIEEEFDFEVAYHGQDVSHYVIQIGLDGKVENKLARGSVQVKKTDTLDVKKEMKGIQFNLSTKEDMSEIISTAMTDDDSIAYFNDLELGTYFIQESQQIDGYALNDHIYKVEVKENGDMLEIECKNQPIEMVFSKVDITNNRELPGATITITEKETGKLIDQWVSTEESHIIHYLVEGKDYIMTELSAPSGYEKAESITFTAKDGVKITMKDKHKPVIVKTGDETKIELYAMMFAASIGAIIIFMCIKRKKGHKHDES